MTTQKERVTIPQLGGDVFVRLAPLGTRFRLDTHAGPNEDRLSILLAGSVVDADGKPLKTAEEWDEFPHTAIAYELLNKAMRLISESQADAEKK